jgi:hypothetical protein
MILFPLVILAALALTIIFAKGTGKCPKGCHGCGKCLETRIMEVTDKSPGKN